MHEDPYVREASRRNLMIEAAVLLCDELVSPSKLLTYPFHRELWQPSGIAGFYSGIVFDTTDTRQSGLLRQIVHHLSRAMGVSSICAASNCKLPPASQHWTVCHFGVIFGFVESRESALNNSLDLLRQRLGSLAETGALS